MIKRPNRYAAAAWLSVALLCTFSLLLIATYGGGGQTLFARAATFYVFFANHVWLLLGLYVVRLLCFLPASLVIFLTGMICGPLLGEIVAVLGLTLGSSIEFALVRAAAASAFSQGSMALLQKWRARINRAPFHSILLLRICFVPFDAVNIAAAIARAPFRSFVFATFLGVTPTTLPIVFAGASISFDDWLAGGRLLPHAGVIQWPYLAASALMAVLITLHGRRRLRGEQLQAEAAGEPPMQGADD